MMRNRINKILQKLFFFERTEFKTKLTTHQIHQKIDKFLKGEKDFYYGRTTENGFFVAEKFRKFYSVVSIIGATTYNSFAPRAKAKIIEGEDGTTIRIIYRMNLLVYVLLLVFTIGVAYFIWPLPLVYLLVHFAFTIPAKNLREKLEDLLMSMR